MAKPLMRRCLACGVYTLKRQCSRCGGADTKSAHPARFSPDDKYARYRLAERYAGGGAAAAAAAAEEEEERPGAAAVE